MEKSNFNLLNIELQKMSFIDKNSQLFYLISTNS